MKMLSAFILSPFSNQGKKWEEHKRCQGEDTWGHWHKYPLLNKFPFIDVVICIPVHAGVVASQVVVYSHQLKHIWAFHKLITAL